MFPSKIIVISELQAGQPGFNASKIFVIYSKSYKE